MSMPLRLFNHGYFMAKAMGGPWTHSKLRQQILKYQSTQYQWSALGPPLNNYRKAAVLVPLCLRDGQIHVWLTKRSNTVGADKGHVAFPGGMKDDGDTDETETCLRESHEEVGLPREQVDVVATYTPRVNSRGILVTPCVGIVSDDFKPTPNAAEVDFAFILPLDRFLSVRGHSVHPLENSRGMPWYVHFFADVCDGGRRATTWGLTANICCEVAVALLQRETEFEYSPVGRLTPDDPFVRQKLDLAAFENNTSHTQKL